MRARGRWIAVSVSLLLGGLPAVSSAVKPEESHDGAVESRFSAADHEAQAREFEDRAAEIRRTIGSHRSMAADYREKGATEAAKHCDRLAVLGDDMAKEYAALAAEHREMASWQGRYRAVLEKVETARHELARAEAEYSSNRHHVRKRGEPRQELVDERANAESRLRRAEQELEDFREEARRAGVPPGWLRDVGDEAANLAD